MTGAAAPWYTATGLTFRRPAGIVLHTTESPALPTPGNDPPRSWHDLMDRQANVIGVVDYADVAWHVAAFGSNPALNRWRPAWLPLARPWPVSAVNCWTIGLEIHSNQTYRNQGRPFTQAQYLGLQQWLLARRAEFGPLPVVGHGHLQTDKGDPWWLDWAKVIAVIPEVDRWMPLAGATRSDPLEGGYAFAEWTGSVYHPGVDLNAGPGGDSDMGAAIRAPFAGTLRWVGYDAKGYGNHCWLEADTGHWLHFCHLQLPPTAFQYQRVPRGATIGYCGKTGGWTWAHLHWEVAYAKPADWSQWPVGWSKSRVLSTYMDPFAYLASTWPDAGQLGGPMELPIFDDAQLAHEIMPALWNVNASWVDGMERWGIPSRWAAELRQGNDLGAPLGPETPLPGGGAFQRFERGTIYYKDGKTTLCA